LSPSNALSPLSFIFSFFNLYFKRLNFYFFIALERDEITSELLSSRVAGGHPARLREVLLLCEAMGALKAQAQEARAQLPQVASAYLAARFADAPPDIPLIIEAISEAQAEGLEQVTEARAQLPRLVQNPTPSLPQMSIKETDLTMLPHLCFP